LKSIFSLGISLPFISLALFYLNLFAYAFASDNILLSG